jgi:hypothetical protein
MIQGRERAKGKGYDSDKKKTHTYSVNYPREKRKIIPFLEGIILLYFC